MHIFPRWDFFCRVFKETRTEILPVGGTQSGGFHKGLSPHGHTPNNSASPSNGPVRETGGWVLGLGRVDGESLRANMPASYMYSSAFSSTVWLIWKGTSHSCLLFIFFGCGGGGGLLTVGQIAR